MNQTKKVQLQDIIANNNILANIPTPCYVLCLESLQSNLKLLAHIAKESGAKILVALKGYSFWREFQEVRKYLNGATCSGVYETRLAYEEIVAKDVVLNPEIPYQIQYMQHNIQQDICVFSPSYKESQMQEIVQYATHIIFNSFAQWHKLKHIIDSKNDEIMRFYQQGSYTQIDKKPPLIQVGLRINPLYSEVEPPIYNPCIPKSRLGIIPSEFEKNIQHFAKLYGFDDTLRFFRENFSGLHFHTHCEQDSSALQRTLPHVIKHFDSYIKVSEWINFGGGHHITRQDYDYKLLISIIRDFKTKYHNIEVFLEPGEAVGWQVGDLIGEVVDIVENNGKVAILDISASCHMPDCLEMPYRPKCYKISQQDSIHSQNLTKDSKQWLVADDLGEDIGKYTYRFGGPTCLAGDVIGDYSFDTPLEIGDRIAFCDMIHYTIVKNTTFNGIELPSLGVVKNNQFEILKQFSYMDFKERN